MRYLHEKFGVSYLSAQFHANLINEYGLAYLDITKGKQWKKPFNFSSEMLDRAAIIISRGPFNTIDPVICLSFVNAVYYFVNYLEACDMLDGIDQQYVKETTFSFYDVVFPSSSISSSLTLCFDAFPFWKAV